MVSKFQKHKKALRFVSLMLALGISLSVSSFNIYSDNNSSAETNISENQVNIEKISDADGKKLISSNAQFELYMNEENLSLVVKDKVSGAEMSSAVADPKGNKTWTGFMQSAVVLTLIQGSVDTLQADIVNDKVEKTITYTENGFSAKLYWEKYELGLTLEVALEANGVVAKIADNSIVENGTTYIGTISMYPMMGYSHLGDKQGYMFVPDGNGTLINLNDKDGKFSSGFSQLIYGDNIGFSDSTVVSLLWDRFETVNDNMYILAPVYGMVHTDSKIGYVAAIESGDKDATIEAHPNGVKIDYNRIYAKFIQRKLYTQPTSNNASSGSIKLVEKDRSHDDLQVRYMFVTGDDANYTGLAVNYREYLLENGLLTQKADEYKTRVDFLGSDREEWIIGTTSVPVTTVDNIEEIYSDLEKSGVTDIMSLYKGWQKGGLYGLPINSFNVENTLGTAKSLSKLIKESDKKGIELYLYNNALHLNPEINSSTSNVVKMVNKKVYTEYSYLDVYDSTRYLLPSKTNEILTKFIKSYTKKDVSNLAIGGITNTLYSYTSKREMYNRTDCADSYLSTIKSVDEKTNLVLEQPFMYLWNYTSSYLDIPLASSAYIFEDEQIPFFSIVLKGIMPTYSEYVNFEANKKEFFLKLVETGTYPSFLVTYKDSAELIYTNSCNIYSSQYDDYKDSIIEYTNELKEINSKVSGAKIIGHEKTGNVVRVTYDNNVYILVNYGKTAETVNGIEVLAMSYKVGNS